MIAHVFGKSHGCEKCDMLKRRLHALLEKEEYKNIKFEFHDILTEEGVVDFCKTQCINPNRVPALVLTHDKENTIALRDKHIMRMSGVAPLISNDGTGIVCGSTFVGVTNDRRVNMFLTSDISKRLSSSATGVKTEIIYLSNICADNVVVAYYDLSDPTIVKLTNASTKGNMREIRVSLISKYKIIGIFNPLEAFILNIPEELRQKNTCHYILFEPNTIKGTHVIKLRNRKFDDQTLTPIVKDSLLLTL